MATTVRSIRLTLAPACRVLLAVWFAAGAFPRMVRAQADAPALVPGTTVTTTPEGRYDASFLQQFFLGSGHRDLWPLTVNAQVLDLDTWAGGLTVQQAGGGLQTRSLRFLGADGQVWNFRSVDKDATRALDPELRNTIAADVMQDRISAVMPLSAMVVDPLLRAAGVLHADPVLVVMPNDPRLGEFQSDYAGLLGWIEVRPDEGPGDQAGFAGSTRVVGSPRLLERIEEDSGDRVDAEAYLRARLMDVFVGDWDRHPDQWRWAGFEDERGARFEPIPRDRDWALSRLNGVIGSVSWAFWPHYVGFAADYPSAFRATWSARLLDRRLLSELTRAQWETVAGQLYSVLTDSVIDQAVSTLPPTYLDQIGDELRTSFRNRRNHLPDFAEAWYELLSGWVDVHATDDAEFGAVDWTAEGGVRVRLFKDRDGEGVPYFDRTLRAGETHELRLYLHGGDDRVRVGGPGPGEVRLRIIGGGGDDLLENATDGPSGNVFFYDARGDNDFEVGPGARVDQRVFEEPFDPAETTHQAPFRDWGAGWLPLPLLTYDEDQGIFLGFGFIRTGFGFRSYPFHDQLTVNAGISSEAAKFKFSLLYDFPIAGPGLRAAVSLYGSGADVNRFYGYGNETDGSGEDDQFDAQRRELSAAALLSWHPSTSTTLAFGPVVKSFAPFETEGTLVGETQPYGFGDFSEVGLTASFDLDTRDHLITTSRGLLVRVEGRTFARALDVEEPFAGLRASGAGFITVPGRVGPTVAVRVGGEKLWGDVPYQEAAYLGGPTSLRGYRRQRYAGQSSVFANSELRFKLTRLKILVPGDVGVYGLADFGRVFVDDETSNVVHAAYGGGAWITLMDVLNLNASVAVGEEQTLFYFVSGFNF